MVRSVSVLRSNFIGVYLKASEDMVLVPPRIEEDSLLAIEEELKVSATKAFINGTNLVGAMSVMNSNGIILPSGYLGDYDLNIPGDRNVLYLEDKINAIGNDIVANDKGAMVHTGFSKSSVRKIQEALGVEVIRGTIGKSKTVGSVSVVTAKGMIVTPDTTEEERSELSSFFKVPVKDATANFGSVYVGSSVVANSKGVLVGESSTPIEIGRIDDALS
ncbi:MAG: translation initiation factor IF-6 [Candidatus Thermoplasmatota archaeon]|nr:translation initiation factor IF-6 [Candidatus Thermoplasmatota archaeon]